MGKDEETDIVGRSSFNQQIVEQPQSFRMECRLGGESLTSGFAE